MGERNFGRLAVWVPSLDWLCRKLELCDVCQALRWSRRAWGRGVRAVPRLCVEYPGICLTTEENHGKPQSSQRALGWSAPNAIRLVDLAIAGDCLDWPAVPCRPWLSRQVTGSTLGSIPYIYHPSIEPCPEPGHITPFCFLEPILISSYVRPCLPSHHDLWSLFM